MNIYGEFANICRFTCDACTFAYLREFRAPEGPRKPEVAPGTTTAQEMRQMATFVSVFFFGGRLQGSQTV